MRLRRWGVCLWVMAFGIAVSAFAGEDPHRRPPVNAAHTSRKAYQRQQFFWQQRAFPLGFIPAAANARAIRARDATRRAYLAQSTAAGVPSQLNGNWVELGPRPLNFPVSGEVSGRVTSIAFDPSNSNVVYLGAATGGIWRSTDAGAHWTPLTDAQPSLAIGALAVVPPATQQGTPPVIYAGTGEGNFSADCYYGIGLLKSIDGGVTWTNLPGPFAALTGYNTPGQGSYWATAHIGAVAVKSGNPDTLLVGAQFPTTAKSGIYRSADGGLTWAQTLSGDAGVEVVFSTADPNLVYAALGHYGTTAAGVYRSTDAGLTWTRLVGSGANVLPLSSVGRIALAATTNTPSSTTTLWAGLENYSSGNLLGLYKSVDGGTNWVKQTSAPNYCGPQCWYDNVIAISPTDTNVVYIGGAANSGLYRTIDGGTTWSATNSSASGTVHVDHHALKFTPDGATLFDGNDGGIWSTSQPGGTINWTNLNHTLGVIQFYSGMSVSPTNLSLAYGGTQDNGTEKFAVGAWNYITCGDGGFTAIDPTNNSTVYATCQNIAIRKSTDAGATFTAVDGDVLISNDRTQFIAPLTIDESQPQNLYFGTYRVWQTRNGAASWTPVSADLANLTGYISTIGVAPGNSAHVFVGTSNGRVVSTTNVFGSPVQWSAAGSGLPTRYVNSIKVDPVTPSTVYAAFSGFTYGGDTRGHIFESIDHGASWVDISGDLPNTPVNDLVVDPDLPNTIYAGTDVGVFRTTNGGANWLPLGNGLPNVPVTSLTLHAATRVLIAATHGRGAWQLGAPSTGSVTLAPAQLNFGAVAVGSTSTAQTLTLTNGTAVAITVTSAQTSVADYGFTNGCTGQIAAAATCAITVKFTPAASGTRNGTFTLVTSASNTPLSVALLGSGTAPTGPMLTLSATSLNFGSVPLGNTSPAKKVTLTNAGTAALNLTSITAGPSVFTMFHNCGAYLAPATSCAVSISFHPASTTSYSGTVSIASNDPAGTKTVTLSGTGAATVDGRHIGKTKPKLTSPQKTERQAGRSKRAE